MSGDRHDLDRVQVNLEASDRTDHHYEEEEVQRKHHSHAWEGGECVRCYMREYWPGAREKCELG